MWTLVQPSRLGHTMLDATPSNDATTTSKQPSMHMVINQALHAWSTVF